MPFYLCVEGRDQSLNVSTIRAKSVKQILIHDCAVSLAPLSWKKKRKIAEYLKKTGRMPLVNGSTHQHLLKNIPVEQRQDRPDILHFSLLLALNYAKLRKLDVLFTIGEQLYQVDSETRLPRDQQRFYGVLESLLSGNNNPYIQKVYLPLDEILLDEIWLFSKQGSMRFDDSNIPDNLTMVFGGRAHSAPRIDNLPQHKVFNLGEKPLELWTATSMVLPRVLNLP